MKKSIVRMIFTVLSVILVFSFSGCSGGSSADSTSGIMRNEGTISGKLTGDGEKSGVFVLAYSEENLLRSSNGSPADSMPAYTVTDPSGSYSFESVSAGNYYIQAKNSSNRVVGHATSVNVAANRVTTADIVLTPTGNISGKALLSGKTDHSGISGWQPVPLWEL